MTLVSIVDTDGEKGQGGAGKGSWKSSRRRMNEVAGEGGERGRTKLWEGSFGGGDLRNLRD